VSEARTLWEEGHEPGRQVVALGLALALSTAVGDVALGGGVGLLFDISFVAVCLLVALLVRAEDFFTVGVLPPLIMLTVVVLVAIWRASALTVGDTSLVPTVLTGLARHAVALGLGYAGCLVCLALRSQFLQQR
jgi:hypothetical protein